MLGEIGKFYSLTFSPKALENIAVSTLNERAIHCIAFRVLGLRKLWWTDLLSIWKPFFQEPNIYSGGMLHNDGGRLA